VKIPTQLPQVTGLSSQEIAFLHQMYQDLQVAVNGGLEVGLNYGRLFSGTFNVAAHTSQDFTHALGRVPVIVLPLIVDTIAHVMALAGPPVIYTSAVGKLLWTVQTCNLVCNQATNVNNLAFIALAL
jgi:hypothetical protein